MLVSSLSTRFSEPNYIFKAWCTHTGKVQAICHWQQYMQYCVLYKEKL